MLTARNPLNSGIPWETKHLMQEKGSAMRHLEDPQRKRGSKRICLLGLERRTALVWDGWEPEEEYTKWLVLKNVHEKIQKLTFRPPLTRFFYTLLPQTIVLSPGTSFSLPVTFRPVKKCEYVDSIEFKSKERTFQVILHGLVLQHALEFPDSLQLPLCAVQHNTNTSFIIRNVSKLQTGFQWTVEPPFELSPDSGSLRPGEKCKVTVTFKPEQVRVYQALASCKFGKNGKTTCTTLIRALSKYPYLQIRSPAQEEGCGLIQFGKIATGSSLNKYFEIYNPTSVTVSFSLTRMRRPALAESMFQCQVLDGHVAPGSTVQVPVSFTPLAVDTTSVDYFSLTYPGAITKNLLKVIGSSIGPVVSLSSYLVNFGCVEEGEEATRTIQIINSSRVPAHYQLDMDAHHSVFSVDPQSGILPAKSSHTLHIRFCPHYPIAYHKRPACLILHREPLFLDLLGTCHSEYQKPSVLHPRHLHVYRLNILRGFTSYPPDVLDAMLAEDKLQLDENGALLLQEDSLQDAPLSRPSLSHRSAMEEFFHNNSADEAEPSADDSGTRKSFPRPHVTVQPTELVFYNGPASQSVTITNHTKGRIKLMWTPADDSPFSIKPFSFQLRPLKSTSFKVTYEPKQHNAFHAGQLECFALYEVLQDHWQTEDQTLCPPWCLTVRVSAHSFQPGNRPFFPHFSLQHPKVVFPAVSQVSYRTVLLQNSGNLPLIFRLKAEECPAVCVLPTSGLVPPGRHQIFTLRSTPSKDRPASLKLKVQLNGNPQHTAELSVLSVLEKLCVTMEDEVDVFFMPTAVGSSSKRTLRIKNLSREPVNFQWRVLDLSNAVCVQPESGLLHSNESQVQTWSFTPLKEMMYTMKAKLTYWPVRIPNSKCSSLTVKVKGQAAKGSLETAVSVLDLGEVLVGGCKTFEVPLLNNSLCAVNFSLTILQSITAPRYFEDFTLKDPNALKIDTMTGTMPARSRLTLYGTMSPTHKVQYCWAINYQILNASGSPIGESSLLCQIKAEGVYPVLEVTDAHSSGSAGDVSKRQLWELFSLDLLNTYLLSEPNPSELTYRVPTRHSVCRCPPAFTSTILDFNFSAASLGTEPSIFLLIFENTGNVPTEWAFLFPEDQQIELEYWAESGDFSSTELHQMKVQENRLFSISPSSGKLQPGQQEAVQFSYRHVFVGTYRLPVLLKLSHGKEILLNFIGVTIERDTHYIQFPSTRHVFAPVAIGEFYPPKQVYELYNRGSFPLKYQVDTSPLLQLQKENFDHPVLQCLTPDGEAQPGHTARLEWLFSPLEPKTYTVDIPIYIVKGDCTVVTFEGHGFDKRDFQPPSEYHSMPCTHRVDLPEQAVFLSQDCVAFGDVPVYSRCTRILFLTNNSRTDRFRYSWNLSKEDGKEQAVQIRPESGSLAVGQSVLCILSVHTSGNPAFHQQGLICEITPEEALARYQKDLQHWEAEKERRKHEFTITKKDVTEGRPHNKTTQVLPPIRSFSSDCMVEESSNSPCKTKRQRPEPPRPTLLHLGVTARSHPMLEYELEFPSEISKHYIYRSVQPAVSQDGSNEGQLSSTCLPPLHHGLEREIFTHVLSSLLRNLLDDVDFQQTLQEVLNEPVPYYSQLQPAVGATGTATHREPQLEGESQHKTDIKVHEAIRRNVELADLVEEILLNTLQNLMIEAFLGEVVLTARPRVIALPPHSARRKRESQAPPEDQSKSAQSKPRKKFLTDALKSLRGDKW